ncbi:MAG: TonB-dependent receptor [Gammaproteobacteria bacterium]|nr:TonB-dependent receptor [Gammaproteobacteria bacterium]
MKRILITAFLLLPVVGKADIEIEKVLVTATRMEMPVEEALSSVVIIDREQIERSMAADVAELLRFHAGLEIGRNGGPGQTTSLFIRGTESNHTLVMIDGVEVNPGTIGGAALQNIVPHVIERIEVVKGPRSSLYGSEAIGGVVNIITRKSEGISAHVGGGRFNTREASISAGIIGKKGNVSASVSQLSSDGYPTLSDATQPDRGYDNQSTGLNAGTTIANTDLSLRLWKSTGNTEYLSFFRSPLDQDYANQATALTASTKLSNKWATTLTLSDITDDIEQSQSPDFAKTERLTVDWQNDISVADRHNIVAGVYLAEEKTRALSFGTGFDVQTDIRALYLEDYIDMAPGQLLLALRYSDYDSFGDSKTWNIEYGHRLANGWRVIGAAGTGFRAPDATDRFGFGGNMDLRPEKSNNLELAIDKKFAGNQSFRLSIFQTDIDDLIDYIFDPVTFAGENLNVAEARIKGIDAGYQWRNSDWEIDISALLQDPEDRQTGQQLARRAKRSLTLNTVRHFDKYSVGLDLLATTARRDSPFADTMNAGYVLASLNANWKVSKAWSLQGRLENLLDRDYETAANFRSPGRGLYLSARYLLQ